MQFRIRQDLRKCGGMFEKFKENGRMKMFLVKKRTLLLIAGIVWLIAGFILITNKTIDKKSSHNPYMQDYARFFVQFLIGS